MRKNVLVKGILVLVVIALLTIGFTGCGPVIQTGTVYITIGGWYSSYTYDIYMDGYYLGWTSMASYMITNVTPGWHTFSAYEYWWYSIWDSKTVYINAGTNYVTLYPW